MANLTLPAAGAVPYPSMLTPRPSRLRKPAPGGEDDMFVSFGINWSTDGGPGNCVLIDLSQSASVLPVSQIVAGYIDNSKSNVDVQLVFLDTQTSTFIPARSQSMVPLVAGATQFYIVAAGAGLGDQTFGVIFNFMPPPVALNETSFAGPATGGNNLLTSLVLQSNTIVGAGISGVITTVQVMLIGVTGGASSATGIWSLVDGVPLTRLANQFFLRNAATYDDVVIYSMGGLNIPFHNGLTFTSQMSVTAAAAGNIQALVTTR